jgi:hypothetical protein
MAVTLTPRATSTVRVLSSGVAQSLMGGRQRETFKKKTTPFLLPADAGEPPACLGR